MSGDDVKGLEDVSVDMGNLYREETFTDLKVASIRRLMPVKSDGSSDESRTPIFLGQTHVMTAAGPVPIQAPIEANCLEEAMAKFPEAVKKAVEKMVEDVKEMRRQEASRIIVPGEQKGNIQLT